MVVETGRGRLHAALSEHSAQLRPAERRVARLLLEAGDACAGLSLQALADRAGVSQAAVVRMCQQIGLPGYREFKLEWLRECAAGAVPRTTGGAALQRLIDALSQTQRLLETTLSEAAATIARAERAFVYGKSGSGMVAELAADGLRAAGRPALAFHAEPSRGASVDHVDASSALLFISHRGQNPELLELLESGHGRGAAALVLTSEAGSPLGRAADNLLLTGCVIGADNRRLALSPARVVQTAAIHLLVQAVAAALEGPNRDEAAPPALLDAAP